MATAWDLTREYPQGYENWLYEVANADTLVGFVEWLGNTEPAHHNFTVRDNVTGAVASQPFDYSKQAQQLCGALNSRNPGGRYGVYRDGERYF